MAPKLSLTLNRDECLCTKLICRFESTNEANLLNHFILMANNRCQPEIQPFSISGIPVHGRGLELDYLWGLFQPRPFLIRQFSDLRLEGSLIHGQQLRPNNSFLAFILFQKNSAKVAERILHLNWNQGLAWRGFCGGSRWSAFSPSLQGWIFCVQVKFLCLSSVLPYFQPFEEDMASYSPWKCKTPTRDGSLCWPKPQSFSYNINNGYKHEIMWKSCQLFQTIDQSQETPGIH